MTDNSDPLDSDPLDSDPLDWGVEEVVTFLCNPSLAPWALSVTSPRPDPVALAAALRANDIGGEALLYDVDSQAIKNDLGVKALGHRSSVNRAIEYLRARSTKYQISKAKASKASKASLPDVHSIKSPLNDTTDSHHQPKTPLATSLESTSTEPGALPVPLQTVAGKRKLAPTLISDPREQSGVQHGAPLSDRQRSSLQLSLHSGPSMESQSGKASPFTTLSNEEDRVQREAKQEAFFDKLLQKYPPNEGVLLGDSGSEESFDSETWGEIVKERSATLDDTANLSEQDVASIMSQYIAEQEERWKKIRLPKQLPDANPLWKSAHNDYRLKSEFEDRLQHLSSRLSGIKMAIQEVQHRSRTKLEKSCMSMDVTIFEICLLRWKLSVLRSTMCPPAVAPPPRGPRSRKERFPPKDAESDESDKSEDIGESSDTDLASESGGLTDFIVSDSEEQNAQRQPKQVGNDNRGELRSPARKRPRITQDEDAEDIDARPGFSIVSSRPERGLEIIDLTDTRSGDTGPAQQSALPGSQDADDMEIETPPLNPTPSAAPQDAEMEPDLSLDSPPIDPVSETRISSTPPSPMTNLGDTLEAQVDEQSSHAPPRVTSGNKTLPVNPDDIELIDTVSDMTYKTIATSKNRLQLLAKTIMDLRPEELQSYPSIMDKMLFVAYTDLVQEALRAMILKQSHLRMSGRTTKENEFAMRMGAIFLSWHHCVRLDPAGISKHLIAEALAAIENDEEEMFATFLHKVRALILAANARQKRNAKKAVNTDGSQAQNPPGKPLFGDNVDDRGLSNVRPTSKLPGKSVNKRKTASKLLSTQQRDAQRRVERQEKARAELERERERKGLSIRDPAGQAVTFKEPMIYLHPELGKFVKPHQLMGIQFMWRELIEATNSQGCLLAHVMGMGKTFQVICLLVTIAAAAASDDPKIRGQIPRKFHRSQTLVMCPSSVIENWMDEFAIWAPQGHKLGTIRDIYPRGKPDELFERFEQIKAWNSEGGVLIMSYEMLRLLIQNKSTKSGRALNSEEHQLLKECLLSGPNIIVADEAHKLKGDKSAISRIASCFESTNRIAMTGSPLANHLSEYYQMVEWISPGYLGDSQSFKSKFMDPIQAGSYMDSTRAEQRASLCALRLLGGILNPKIHRADTSAIASDLPSKTEFVISVPLTSLQKMIYDTFVTCLRTSSETDAATKLWAWLALLQLCCNHPYPFREKLADRSRQPTDDHSDSPEGENASSVLPRSITDAGLPSDLFPRIEALFKGVNDSLDPVLSHRSTLLDRILDESIKVGDKVLVFSQSIPTMDYLDALFEKSGRKYLRIDGRTLGADRQRLCKQFNTSDREHVFLISTRAGGLGLNIFGANRVVIFDFLFNPTWEEQAIGRAYRLGQKKPVFVYRFVAGGTFEENIFNTAVFKSQLAVRVVDKKNTIREGAKKTEQYLQSVRDVAKEDHDGILGKDPEVLDKIFAGQFADIVLKVNLSHIQDNENDRLTDAERERVDDELHMERLKRSDRPAFEAELERRQVRLAEKQKADFRESQRRFEEQRQRLQSQRPQTSQLPLDVRQRVQSISNTPQASPQSPTSGVTGPMQFIYYMPTAMGLVQRDHDTASAAPMGYLPSSISIHQPRSIHPVTSAAGVRASTPSTAAAALPTPTPTPTPSTAAATGVRAPTTSSATAAIPTPTPTAAAVVHTPTSSSSAAAVPAPTPSTAAAATAVPTPTPSSSAAVVHTPTPSSSVAAVPAPTPSSSAAAVPAPTPSIAAAAATAATAVPAPTPPIAAAIVPAPNSATEGDTYSPPIEIGESDKYSPPSNFPPLR